MFHIWNVFPEAQLSKCQLTWISIFNATSSDTNFEVNHQCVIETLTLKFEENLEHNFNGEFEVEHEYVVVSRLIGVGWWCLTKWPILLPGCQLLTVIIVMMKMGSRMRRWIFCRKCRIVSNRIKWEIIKSFEKYGIVFCCAFLIMLIPRLVNKNLSTGENIPFLPIGPTNLTHKIKTNKII